MRKSGKSGRLLLRQVVLNHGHSVPGFPLGSMRRWLELLPSSELSRDMDRCTVVLPRPGDGWYAPPSSGTSAGAGPEKGEVT
ncbi:2-succinyl-5-enolpyruvyl-6-hydroxy-3-cyclohexene-1-carboxylate synthase [Durusdinium trenchii]|uniref:2-succinyl-5-enolpyruvyl-6-hydroxy-3-cyclohexene-1-carboxylate synthase n=1 Tax=Durusdinium trenchii TaxID=1381693 RepID=A0ABP0S5S1_9DINO